MDTKGQLEAIIHQMIASGEKVNVSRVAQKAGVSNALIYNRYPELKSKKRLNADLKPFKIRMTNYGNTSSKFTRCMTRC